MNAVSAALHTPSRRYTRATALLGSSDTTFLQDLAAFLSYPSAETATVEPVGLIPLHMMAHKG